MNVSTTRPRLHLSQPLCRRIRSSMVIDRNSLWSRSSIPSDQSGLCRSDRARLSQHSGAPRPVHAVAGLLSPSTIVPRCSADQLRLYGLSGTARLPRGHVPCTPPPLRAVTPISTKPDVAPSMVRGARRADFAARLKGRLRTLRARVERRDAVIEAVREANASLDPAEGRRRGWSARRRNGFPRRAGPSSRTTSTDSSTVLADAGLTPSLGPSLWAAANWVMRHGAEFFAADLAHDSRAATRRRRHGDRVSARLPPPHGRRAGRPRPAAVRGGAVARARRRAGAARRCSSRRPSPSTTRSRCRRPRRCRSPTT